MLDRARSQDADLLGRLVEAATVRARTVLGGQPALVQCEAVRIDGDSRDSLTFEAWCVREDGAAATITAFAIAHDDLRRERIAASGRFTFSIPTSEKDTSA